jgi:hypothetical protein
LVTVKDQNLIFPFQLSMPCHILTDSATSKPGLSYHQEGALVKLEKKLDFIYQIVSLIYNDK